MFLNQPSFIVQLKGMVNSYFFYHSCQDVKKNFRIHSLALQSCQGVSAMREGVLHFSRLAAMPMLKVTYFAL